MREADTLAEAVLAHPGRVAEEHLAEESYTDCENWLPLGRRETFLTAPAGMSPMTTTEPPSTTATFSSVTFDAFVIVPRWCRP